MAPRPRSLPARLTTPDTVTLYDRVAFPELTEVHDRVRSDPAPRTRQPAAVYAVQARLRLRIIAKLIDGATAGVLYCLCTLAFDDWTTGFLVAGVVGGLYFTFADALLTDGASRRSPGKQLVGLHLARLDRGPIDAATSLRRNGFFASAFFVQAFTFSAPALSLILLGLALMAIGAELWRSTTSIYTCRWGDEMAGTEVLQHRIPRPTERVHVLHTK